MYKIIKTKSGSSYTLFGKNGRTFLMKGFLFGEVLKFNEEVKVGGSLNVNLLKENIYGQSDYFPTLLRSSTIISIEEP